MKFPLISDNFHLSVSPVKSRDDRTFPKLRPVATFLTLDSLAKEGSMGGGCTVVGTPIPPSLTVATHGVPIFGKILNVSG